ncbi:MAG: AAA family ATPase [Deltaproteobacteria bacterium]|nr:AAA family ATPase [Deltaproteobacteria bacterium]
MSSPSALPPRDVTGAPDVGEALAAPLTRLRAALGQATAGLVGREAIAELVLLCAVAGEHMLVVGPPGTAKSAAVRRVAQALGAQTFEYLLGRFTEPAELFGPVDLRRLREGELVVETTGMLPEAEIAFLDELFLGSTAILNSLLGLLNERRFRRGRTTLTVPLRVCVGACNHLPEDPALAALADRFLLRVFVDALPDARLEELLEAGAAPVAEAPPAAHVADLDALRAAADAVDLGPARPALAEALRTLRAGGVPLSDRRMVRSQRLVAAAAALAGRSVASPADLWPLLRVAPTAWEQERAQALLPQLLAAAAHPHLTHAVAAASDGPAATAGRLQAALDALLAADLKEPGARARLLGWLRDVDVAFAPEDLPAPLAAARAAALGALGLAQG